MVDALNVILKMCVLNVNPTKKIGMLIIYASANKILLKFLIQILKPLCAKIVKNLIVWENVAMILTKI